MNAETPKLGAPKGNQNAAKDLTADGKIQFRLPLAQKGKWVAAARENGQPLTQWLIEAAEEKIARPPVATSGPPVTTSGPRVATSGAG